MKFFLLLLIFSSAIAQNDTLKNVTIQEVIINQIRPHFFQTGTKKITIDSVRLFHQTSLADILMSQNFGQIQAYSPGQLATPSFRGTSASHTAVLWNGFNIQSQMNGQADFNLIQNISANQVKIQFGGAGAMFGSGAVGGVIELNNKLEFNKGILAKIQANFGSFSNFRQQAEVQISKQRWASELKIFNQNAKNDFIFINPYLPEKKEFTQTNAAYNLQGIAWNNAVKINYNQQLDFSIWLQQADRQIPPTLFSFKKRDAQLDENIRTSINYSFTKKHYILNTRVGYFNEKIIFQRPLYDTLQNKSQNIIGEIEAKIAPHQNHNINVGINYSYAFANGINLPENSKLSRIAFFSAYKYSILRKRLNLQISVREQFNNLNTSPVTFGAGMEAKIVRKFIFSANVSKNYRLPTFNDLYWRDANGSKGNVDLKAESGWSQDVGVKYTFTKNDFEITLNSNIFSSFTDDWISWRENEFGKLSSQNLQAVWARGLEGGFFARQKIHKNLLHSLQFNADYTVSTVEKTSDKNQNMFKKQLIYVPYNKAFINYKISLKNTSLLYQWTYTGFRYSTEDNAEFLPSFQISNIEIAHELGYRKFMFNAFLRLNNIFNQYYQVLASRPMLGFNFNLGTSIKFYSPIKNKNYD